MSVATGLGFDVSELSKMLDKLDKQLEATIKDSDKLQKNFDKLFKGAGNWSVLDKVDQIRTKLIDISKVKDPLKWDSKGVSNYIDQVNRLIRTLNAINTASGVKDFFNTKELEKASVDFKKILSEVKRYEKQVSDRTTSRNQSYSGALKYSNNVKTLEQERQAIINLEAARDKLKKTDSDYSNKLNTLNEAIQRHEKNLKDATKTDQQRADEAKKASEKIIEASRREREEYEKRKKSTMDKWYSSNSERALKFSSNAKTLEDEARAIKYLEAARAKLNTQDRNYEKNLSTLNSRIREHKKNLDDAKRGAQELQDKHKGLLNTGEQLKRALLGVFSVSAIKGYVSKLVEVRGEFELQHRTLTVLVGDVAEANRLWNKTVQLAVKSPFAVKELVTYTKQLSAYRVESDKLYDTTKMLADISAGLGVDMNRLILAYGQVKAANYLRGTELRQFSEAGINVLKELSDYYTEIEGKTISVGEVFDRVSKRMVSFQDVNTVLEKVTGAGGQFYKMQEQQAETLKGVWMNMRDSVDLMLNDIGSKNSSILKGALSIAKSVVDNWEKVSNIVVPLFSMIIAKMAVMKTMDFFKGSSFQVGINKMEYLWKLLTKGRFAADRFALSLGGVDAKAMKMSAYGTIISAAIVLVAKLTMEFVKHRAELKEIDKEYENIRESLSDATFNFNVAKNENDLKKQKESLSELVSIANKEYSLGIKVDIKTLTPEEVDSKVKEITGQILRITALAQEAEKSGKGDWFSGIFTDDANEDAEDYGEAFSSVSSKITLQARNAANAIAEYKEQGNELTEIQKEALKTFTTPFDPKKETEVQYVEKLTKAYMKLLAEANRYASQSYWEEGRDQLIDDIYKRYGISEDVSTSIYLLRTDRERFKAELKRFFDGIEDDLTGTSEQKAIDVKAVIDKQSWSDASKEFAYQIANERFGIQITPIIEQPDEKTIANWQIEYNKFVDTLSTGKVLKMDANTDAEQYISILKGTYETYAKTIKAWDAGNAKARAEYSKEEIESIRKQNNERKKALDWLVYEEKKKSEENEALQRLKKQISLIRDAARAYDEMRKLHDEAYASERIVSDYEDAFREAGLGDIGGYSFGTREDELNNLNKLKNSAEQVTGGMLELSKATAQVGVQVDNANKELADKRLFDAISDIFSNYEISLEMDKLNIPSDLAEKIFGFEAIDLNDIRRKVLEKFGLGFMSYTSNQEIYESDLFKSMSKERQDELRKSLEMESKLQDDALKDRLKTYTKYLREEQDERIKIKLEEIRKLEEVESMNEYDDAQKATIKANIRAEAEKDMMKKRWESFEQSPDFLNLFDDMSKATTQSLEDTKRTLDKLKGSMIAAGLPASDLKEILDKINKVEEELENRKPFQSLKEDWSTLFGSDYKKALDDEKTLLEERRRLEDEKKSIEDSGPDDFQLNRLNTEKDRLSSMEKGSEEYRQQKELVDSITKSLYPNQERYEEILKLLEQNGVKLDEAQSKTRKWKDSCEDIAEHFIAIGDAVNQVGSALGTTLVQMGLMSEETKAIYDSYMSVADNALNLGGNVMKLIANPADPQAWVGAITSTISMIGNIAATGDAVREKQIQAELKNVDRLERAYEKLEKEMEDAYNIDLLNANRMSMEQNIDDQIKALESAKAKEEANKNVDQDAVDDYADRINELEEKKAELQRETVERLGGTYDYASVAEDFLDDWLTAFEETGDGLSGLEKSFDEFWKNILKKQVIYRGAADIVKNYVDSINKALENDSIISDQEEKDIAAAEELAKEKLNAYFAYMNEKYNLANLAEGELSGLQAGIQGITEEQAGILEAYWNAVRMDVSAVRFRFEDYANKMLSSDVEVNPMLSQLTSIANHTSAINTLLDSVAKNSADDGSLGIRVYMNNA